jgi:hypothetical protein
VFSTGPVVVNRPAPLMTAPPPLHVMADVLAVALRALGDESAATSPLVSLSFHQPAVPPVPSVSVVVEVARPSLSKVASVPARGRLAPSTSRVRVTKLSGDSVWTVDRLTPVGSTVDL